MKRAISFTSLCVKEANEARTTTPHVLPIYATSSFAFDSLDQGMAVFGGEEKGHLYSRFGNPTVDAVAEKIAALEAYGLLIEAMGLLFSSGMAAISTLILGVMTKGDKILTQNDLYGGTSELFKKILLPLGIEPVFANLRDLAEVEAQLRANASIRMIYFETPANPTMACIDMEGIAALARRYSCFTTADNTFCTPCIQQPLAFGVDFVVHSTTKYLNGHGNSIGGVLVGRDPGLVRERIWPALKLLGPNSNPWDAWLINNGLKTLSLRMERHSSNALRVAQFLETHPQVERVNYPGLAGHPDQQLIASQMKLPGGMLSFELKGGFEAGKKCIDRMQFCTLAPTLGDVDTLVMHPASMSHRNVPREIRLNNGIPDGLIRISVGIEAVEDILADLTEAIQ